MIVMLVVMISRENLFNILMFLEIEATGRKTNSDA